MKGIDGIQNSNGFFQPAPGPAGLLLWHAGAVLRWGQCAEFRRSQCECAGRPDAGSATGVSKANTTRQPVAGTCTVSGSQAGNGHKIGVSLLSVADVDFGGSSDNEFGRPGAAATIRANFNVPDKVTVIGGSASFKVWGKLSIPARIIRENYGAYMSVAPVQVQVIDAAVP